MGKRRGQLTMSNERVDIITLITEACNSGAKQDGRIEPQHSPKHKLTELERQRIIKVANEPELANLPPCQIVPRLADTGIYIASEASFYRVLNDHNQLKHRVEEERKNANTNSATDDEPSTNGAASISKKRELNSDESSSSSVVAGNERPFKKAKTNMDANHNAVDAAFVLSSDETNKNELKEWFLSLSLGSKGIELFDLLWMKGVENMKILRQVDDGMLKEIGIKLVQRRLLMKAISKLSSSSLSV